MPAWEPVIGLEVHVHLKTRSKIFCRCENRFGAEPNSLVCPVCLGYPGTLPVLNGHAVDLAATLALALGCEVHQRSVFARKNYFYADLPKGYQISQSDRPLAERGNLPLTEHARSVRVHRLHLEEDAGKLLHEWPGGGPTGGVSLVDFNRCGVPLVEIVSEPEIASAAEAEDYLRSLHQVLLFTGASPITQITGQALPTMDVATAATIAQARAESQAMRGGVANCCHSICSSLRFVWVGSRASREPKNCSALSIGVESEI